MDIGRPSSTIAQAGFGLFASFQMLIYQFWGFFTIIELIHMENILAEFTMSATEKLEGFFCADIRYHAGTKV